MKFFKKTKDYRGKVYYFLTVSQTEVLKGNNKIAKQYLSRAISYAEKYGFNLELCHGKNLYEFLDKKTDTKNSGCHNILGIKIHFDGIPFNIP